MKKKIKYISMVMIIFVSALFFVPMEDVHANRSAVLPYNEPWCDDNSGYLVVEFYNETKGYHYCTYFWSANVYDSGTSSDMYSTARVWIYQNQVMVALYPPTLGRMSAFLCAYYSDGSFALVETENIATSIEVPFNLSGSTVATGYYFKGNVEMVTTDITNSGFSVAFADNGATQININSIIMELVKLNEDTDVIISNLISIYNSNANINTRLLQIYNLLSNQIHAQDNARIIELLEMIEYYLCYPDNGSGEKIEDFGSIITDKNNSKQESDNEVDESIPMDENGVTMDDYGQYGRDMLDIVDSVTDKSMEIYTDILNLVTDYPFVTTMILIVFVFAFCGFIFFGRR